MVQNINAYHQDKITVLALEFCRGPWQWRSMANGSFGKPKKVCDDSEVAKFWRGFNIFPARKYLCGECTQQEKHLEVGVTSFSRGICCPTAEYEIYIYMNICCLWYISSCFIHLWRRELLSYPLGILAHLLADGSLTPILSLYKSFRRCFIGHPEPSSLDKVSQDPSGYA